MNENIHHPVGTIIRRNIRGKTRFYHQWREDGKTKSRYLKPGEVLPLREQLDKLKKEHPKATPRPTAKTEPGYRFNSAVLTGNRLEELAFAAAKLGRRRILDDMIAFADSGENGLFILHGFPGSGKSTLLRQTIAAMPPEKRALSAYLSIPQGMSPSELFADLDLLKDRGAAVVLIDGLERMTKSPLAAMEDFIPALALKVIAATGEAADGGNRLPQRRGESANIITFRDYCEIEKTRDVKSFLRHGGIDRVFLPEKLNRAMEDAVLRLIAEAVDPRLRRHPGKASNRVENDIAKISRHISERVPAVIDRAAMKELERLDVVVSAEDEFFLALPALRSRLVRQTVKRLLDEDFCSHLGAAERKLVGGEIYALLEDRALAQTVLTETIRSRGGPTVDVFRVRFPHGGFDIVVADREELTCELYEVRNTDERASNQLFNLADQIKLDTVEHRYGTIIARELIYLGRNARHSSGVVYRNAADYLESLPRV